MLTFIVQDTQRKGAAGDDSRLEDLLHKVALRDESAFQVLYESTKSAVYGFALSIVKNPHDAEDVMQETYLTLYKAAASYQPQGKPMAWILRITRNFSLLKLRDRKRQQPMSWEEMERWMDEKYQLQSEDKLVLEAAMTSLSDEERQIVSLHALGGLRHREIAQILDLKLSTVLSKYNRALKKLKESIGEV